MREFGVLLVFGERPGSQNLAAFHVEVILGASERVLIAGFLDVIRARGGGPQRGGCTHDIRVKAFVRTGESGIFAAVAQRKENDIVGLSRQDPSGGGDSAA